MSNLIIKSSSFDNNGLIDKKYTGFADDISPDFELENIDKNATSIAIIMDDLDVPFTKSFNHWVIWNIPITNKIPEHIPFGTNVESLGNAVQGVGWGKHIYRGPKQPPFIHKAHKYVFRFFVLDTFLNIDCNSKKNELINAMKEHIIQHGEYYGIYKP